MEPYERKTKASCQTSFKDMSVGDRVKWLLVVRQLTQSEAAVLIGVSQSTLANLISKPERKPSSTTLLSMAKVLDCKPTFLIQGLDPPTVQNTLKDAQQEELLTLFQNLSPIARQQLLVFARMLIPPKEKAL